MTGTMPERVRLLLSVTSRGNGRELTDWIAARGVGWQLRLSGRGTASSEMMDILGLGSDEKDVVLSLGSESAVDRVVADFSDNMSSLRRGVGIMMLLSPDAAGSMIAVMLGKIGARAEKKGGEVMKNEHKHTLILISVNQGYTDAVMKAAREEGATGGTAVRARLVGEEPAKTFQGLSFQPEKEVLMILAPESIKEGVMNRVNREFGLSTEAEGVLCSVPVDKAFKI